MKLLGLIGYPLDHSFSVPYFREKFRNQEITGYEYLNFPIKTVDELKTLITEHSDLAGLNVTIPYKQAVIPYLDHLDPLSREIGAVNTIRISRQKDRACLEGFNTDVYGFYHSLSPLLKGQVNRALILGTGGASMAVAYALKLMKIDYLFVSRKPLKGMLGYNDLCQTIIKNHNIIINTTPAGTWPDISEFPDIPYDLLSNHHILFDLVYNPPETKFMELGKRKGAMVMNGFKMLTLQAERSWEIWTSGRNSISPV
jgi:shikimate dehydrogenase